MLLVLITLLKTNKKLVTMNYENITVEKHYQKYFVLCISSVVTLTNINIKNGGYALSHIQQYQNSASNMSI